MSIAKRVLQAAPGAATTGNYIVKLSQDTTHERFLEVVNLIEHDSDSTVHSSVDGQFAKFITARLSEDAIKKVWYYYSELM